MASDGPTVHLSQVDARSAWAREHGLEPDDGAYLFELSSQPLTMQELGEALAIYSQTCEMIDAAVDRLLVGGFVCLVEA